MDTLTHALSGALIARATVRPAPGRDALPLGRRLFVGFFAGAFPDIDFVTSYLSPLSYLYHHRGITHSILLIPLWAALIAVIFAALWRFRPGWRAYFGVATWGISAHIAGDWITNFGTILFAPFSDARFALSTTFIIDLWFTAIILLGLLASLVWKDSRKPALAGLAVLAAYVGFQWVLQQQAIDFGERYARGARLRGAVVTAMPRPVMPFNWTVIVAEDSRYHYAHVNLVRKEPRPKPTAETHFVARLDAPYRPLDQALWLRAERYGARGDAAEARAAYEHSAFRFFRWFAAYPVLYRNDRAERCVWFQDLRFVTPGRDTTPFRYGMCRERDNEWRPFQLLGGARLPVY